MVEKLKPWLWLSPACAHRLSPLFLKFYGRIKPLQAITWKPTTWRHLEFTNPLGTAGGVDKNGDCIDGWWSLGVGFIETGTVTPKPQNKNKGVTLKRHRQSQAVWNRLGFPNQGAQALANRLKKLYQPHFTPIFVNIGKNRETPLEKAHEDYIQCLRCLKGLADVFVINISSPNTEGLRELLKPDNLKSFLSPIMKANIEMTGSKNLEQSTPLLLKISPDVELSELEQIIEISCDLNIDGWVLTNTSLTLREKLPFPRGEGGVSGHPLAKRSTEVLKFVLKILGEKRPGKLIVSAGGIMSADDVLERLQIGADLVQVYSALIFNGPFFFRQVADDVSLRVPLDLKN